MGATEFSSEGTTSSSAASRYPLVAAVANTSQKRLIIRVFGGLLTTAALVALVVWVAQGPGLGFREWDRNATGAAAGASSSSSGLDVYLGNGCFWHTQFDTVTIEQDPSGPFGRTDIQVTSRVGYAGGDYAGPGDKVCYHGGPPGTMYETLGHGEACRVTLDNGTAVSRKQMTALLKYYFEDGFSTTAGGRTRLDPQDGGPPYRNLIGLPGGMKGAMYDLVVAGNVHNMKLIEGKGGPSEDTLSEYVVYIYDSLEFKFHVGETYHQFHTNPVLGRYVPPSYLKTLRDIQIKAGMSSPCDARRVLR